MTSAQRARFFGDWWPRIAARRGVQVNDRAARHAFYAEAGLTGDINTTTGFDALKARCLAILDDANIDAQVAVQEQPLKRLHWKIRDVLKCLAIYPLSAPMGLDGARAYAREIIRDKVNHGSWRNVSDIEDLSDQPRTYADSDNCLIEIPHSSQIGQLRITLWARVQVLRNAAAHTLHDMKQLAGVQCDCKPCKERAALQQHYGRRAGRVRPRAPQQPQPVPAHADEGDTDEPF